MDKKEDQTWKKRNKELREQCADNDVMSKVIIMGCGTSAQKERLFRGVSKALEKASPNKPKPIFNKKEG